MKIQATVPTSVILGLYLKHLQFLLSVSQPLPRPCHVQILPLFPWCQPRWAHFPHNLVQIVLRWTAVVRQLLAGRCPPHSADVDTAHLHLDRRMQKERVTWMFHFCYFLFHFSCVVRIKGKMQSTQTKLVYLFANSWTALFNHVISFL